MKISGKKPWYVEYMLIVIGTGLMGFAITSAFDAAGLVTGGFSGVAIIVKAWTESFIEGGIPLWMTNFCLNVPVFLLGIKIRGFAFAKKAFIGDMCLTVWLAVLPGFSIAGGRSAPHGCVRRNFPGSRHRSGVPGTGHHRRNRYDGGSDPDQAAPLYHCPDHADHRRNHCSCRRVRVWDSEGAVCDHCSVYRDQGI